MKACDTATFALSVHGGGGLAEEPSFGLEGDVNLPVHGIGGSCREEYSSKREPHELSVQSVAFRELTAARL